MVSCESCGQSFAAEPPERLPKRLPCLDVFCAGCIAGLLQEGAACPNPICQAKCNADGSPPPPIDRLTMELVAKSGGPSAPPLCDCEERPVTVNCGICDADFCDSCDAEWHAKGKRKAHVRIPISGDASGAAIPALQFMCKVHPDKVLELYCATCSVLVCLKW